MERKKFGVNNATQLEEIKIAADSQQLTVFYIITPDINSQDPSGNTIKWLAANTVELGNAPGIAVRLRMPNIGNITPMAEGGT